METTRILQVVEWMGLLIVLFNFILAFLFSDTWGFTSDGFKWTLNTGTVIVFGAFLTRKVLENQKKKDKK